MPKAEPHFDADGLIQSVHAQDIGLRVTTNDPAGFKRIVYKAASRLGLKIHIYSYPRRPKSLALMPRARPNLKEEPRNAA